MRGPHNLWRLMRTGATFERSGAMRIALDAMNAPRSIRIAARLIGFPLRFLGYRGDPKLPPILRAITALGPAYIKFGQLLSTRADIVGQELASELSVLQDAMPCFDMKIARQTIEQELDAPLEKLFLELEPPIAAASLAQVHPARLLDGRQVAVKVLRPNIERAFLRDVEAFHLSAWLVESLTPASKRLRLRDVIEHFEQVVRTELDLRMEASVGNEYAENVKDDPIFVVPDVIWSHSAKRVLTTTWLEGVPLTKPNVAQTDISNPKIFAENIISSFLKQALRDGLFHADMHQGNLKVLPGDRIGALDFGIMGRIDLKTRRIYAQILYGFLQRDYDGIARVHFEAGYVPATEDPATFAQALRSIGEPIFGQQAENISMARLLSHLFEITEAFGMETRTELILLQRTMVVAEGVARSIHPDTNLWEAARGEVESYIRDSLGPKAMLHDVRQLLRSLSSLGPELPSMIDRLREGKKPSTAEKHRDWAGYLLAALISSAMTYLMLK